MPDRYEREARGLLPPDVAQSLIQSGAWDEFYAAVGAVLRRYAEQPELDEKGALRLMAAHGSLLDLGKNHQDAGISRAILLDNGGSVGYRLISESSRLTQFIGQGTYMRPRGHAVLVAILKEKHVEPPFRSD